MKAIKLLHIFSALVLSVLINSLDISTLSNYQNITINYIEGQFKPDFENKIVHGILNYSLIAKDEGKKIIFDTNNLNIKKITNVTDQTKVITHSFGNSDENLGTPLLIDCEYNKDDNVNILIEFETTTNGRSAQFLTKEQTFGKQHPYFFTQSEMILGRSLFPCQDTPAVKFQFDLSIIVPKDLKGMISGIYKSNETFPEDENYTVYHYKQEMPVPSYLVSMAAGNIVNKTIKENMSVFSEPEYIEEAYNELKDDLPKAFELAVNYLGEYKWKEYNVLVLPRSFPYSGMENPSLSFLSPCLINGDKSLIDIIFHEMIHSWSGNLVTNENWSDFWLNEGITMFLQRKIVGLWKNDSQYARMDGYLGMNYIQEYIDYFGEEFKDLTTLRPNLTGMAPDDSFSDIPYEKGYNLIYYIESLIGENVTKKFFQNYFIHFENQSITFYDFKDYFIEFCSNNSISGDILRKIDLDAWIFTPGNMPVNFTEENKYKFQSDNIVDKIKNEKFDGLATEFNETKTVQKTYILLELEKFDNFLTDNQHKFLTETLKLYENQNFLITTYYFRIILEKTDKFLPYELDSLIQYLSDYGCLDYMTGLYEAFYKRDEVKAVEILHSLKTFYHSLMYETALEEFENAEKEFPIFAFNIKGDKPYYYPYDDMFELNLTNYNDELDNLTFENNIYLNSENANKFGLNCYFKKEIQYCQLKNKTFEQKGQFNITVKERYQALNFAIKAYTSNNFQIKQLFDKENMKTSYNFNLAKGDIFKITIKFNEAIDFNLPVYFNDKKELLLRCQLHEKNYECEFNKTFCESNCKVGKDEQKFQANIMSKSEQTILNLDIFIKNDSEEKQPEGKEANSVLVVVCVTVSIILALVITFFLLMYCRKRRRDAIDYNKELL